MINSCTICPFSIDAHSFGFFLRSYVNHALYWELMTPNKEEIDREPFGKVAEDIAVAYQSFKKFQLRFSDAANKLFGSGETSCSPYAYVTFVPIFISEPLLQGTCGCVGRTQVPSQTLPEKGSWLL